MILKEQNILIVGGSSGIGLALVSALSSAGATLFNFSRTSNEHWPPEIKHMYFDVLADPEPAAGFLPEILHGLVYLPGTINLKPFNRLNEDDFLNDYQLNVIGATKVIRQAVPALKNSSDAC